MLKWIKDNQRMFEFITLLIIGLMLEFAFTSRFITSENYIIEPRYFIITLASISFFPAIFMPFKSSKVRFTFEAIYIVLQLTIFVSNTSLFYFKDDLFSLGMLLDISDGLKMGIKYNVFVAYSVIEWIGIFVIIIGGIFFLKYLNLGKNYAKKKRSLVTFIPLLIVFSLIVISGNLVKSHDKPIYRLPQDKRNFVLTFGVSTFNQKDTFNTIVDIMSKNYQRLSANELLEDDFDELTPKSLQTGRFADHNVVMIMMETVEEYAVDEQLTPTLYKLLHDGYYFSNAYGVAKTNYTYDAEFKSLTSMMYYNADNYMYTYENNEFTNSLPSILSSYGYSANSFHGYDGTYFNRIQMHKALGFERYYSHEDMVFSEVDFWPLDSELFMQMKDEIAPIQDNPFYSFIITLSTHGSFSTRRTEFEPYYHKIAEDGRFEKHEEEFITLLAAQMDLDKGLNVLIEDLEAKGLLEDTLLVLYSDHKNYSSPEITKKYSENINHIYDYDKIPFAIYNPKIESQNIEYQTSQYDITPTVLDLVGIRVSKYNYYGQSVFLYENDLYETLPIILGYNRWIDDKLIVYDKEIIYQDPDLEDPDEYYNKTRNKIHDEIERFHAFFITDYFRTTPLEE